jgi:type IX secretion system PorP/SprF family membrane protein
MKAIKIVLVGMLFFGGLVRGQDFHLSLYDAGPLFLNPAMTGLVDAKMRVHAQYRNQWRSVANKPFTTALLSFDMPQGKWGYGGQVINMRAGIGNYNVFQFLGSTAYSLPIDKNQYHNITFGLQAGFTQKSIREEYYTFDEQYTTAGGGSFDKGIDNKEDFSRISQLLPQLNAGAMYYFSKQQSLINPFIGVSGFNLTRPKETFFDQSNHLPIKINIHTGLRVNITELIYVIPKVLIITQGKASEQTYALDAGYFLTQGDLFILGGYVLRAGDASVVSLGCRKENYIFKVGYDFNTSSLKTATRTRGAWELSFTYLMGKEKLNKIKHCPRL